MSDRQAPELLRQTLGNVSVPEHMHGDNLAILLASFYEDAEGEVDDNGWTETAIIATEKTLDAIHAHYVDTHAAALARIKRLKSAIGRLENLTAHDAAIVAAALQQEDTTT